MIKRGRAERTDLIPILARIKVPALIIVGEQNKFMPVKQLNLSMTELRIPIDQLLKNTKA